MRSAEIRGVGDIFRDTYGAGAGTFAAAQTRCPVHAKEGAMGGHVGITAGAPCHELIARASRRSAITRVTASQSMSRKLCMGQNFGPHIEQNSADLK